jgi:hypothetical protein
LPKVRHIALWLAKDGQKNSALHFKILRIARRFRVTGRFINAQRLTCKKKGRFDNRPLKHWL